jgi:hypothetical protein
MAWLFGIVVLVLLVASAGFQRFALGLVALGAAGGGAIYLYNEHEESSSLSRIPISEWFFENIKLKPDYSSYKMSGRIKNNSRKFTPKQVAFVVTMQDCAGESTSKNCIAIGKGNGSVYLGIPPGQARDFGESIYFSGGAMETPAPPGEGAAPAFAAEARSKIATVLAAEEFGHSETTTSLRARRPESNQAKGGWTAGLYGFLRRGAKVLAAVGETLLWVAAALAIFLIVYSRGRWLPFLGRLRRMSRAPPVSREVRLTSAGRPLPDDIPSAALALWQAGRHAEALGLLYRGAIARAHERFDLRLAPGATEGEALRAIAQAAPGARAYFAALTAAWMALAYARLAPEAIAPEIEPLAEGFRRHLEET